MKKGLIISHLVFTSFAICCLVLWIVAVVLLSSIDYNDIYYNSSSYDAKYNTALSLSIAMEVLSLIGIIGTFVTSIIVTSKAKHCEKKGKAKGSGIVGIVGGSLGIIFAIIGFSAGIIYPLIAFYILSIVSFGLAIPVYKSISA